MVEASVVRCGCCGCLTDDCEKWGETCRMATYDPCTIGRVIINGTVYDIGVAQRRAGAIWALENTRCYCRDDVQDMHTCSRCTNLERLREKGQTE